MMALRLHSARRPRAMNSAAAPEMRRDEVCAAQQELESLRALLEDRLAALEAALESPNEGDSLESLVLDLSRVATEEAQAAARRACLETQLDAETRMAAVRATAQRAVDIERSAGADLRHVFRESEQQREALEREV